MTFVVLCEIVKLVCILKEAPLYEGMWVVPVPFHVMKIISTRTYLNVDCKFSHSHIT